MFLLVPAHPGCPGQIPQSRKTVVCVCVWCSIVNKSVWNHWRSRDWAHAHPTSARVGHEICTNLKSFLDE